MRLDERARVNVNPTQTKGKNKDETDCEVDPHSCMVYKQLD